MNFQDFTGVLTAIEKPVTEELLPKRFKVQLQVFIEIKRRLWFHVSYCDETIRKEPLRIITLKSRYCGTSPSIELMLFIAAFDRSKCKYIPVMINGNALVNILCIQYIDDIQACRAQSTHSRVS